MASEPTMPMSESPKGSPSALQTSFSGSTVHGGFERSDSSGSEGSEDHDIVPPYHPARTLVLCFDGTGDQFDADNSNVVTFFSLLKKDDRDEQMVYYQPGIGTYTSNTQNVEGIKSRVDKLLDAMIAWNLGAHVMAGYEFLMQNYKAGDKICLFGFSRGAYTARALAGMVHKVGLLPACNHQQVPFAYRMYTRDDPAGWAQSTTFKKAFSIDVDIEFVGVWDTVDSVGIIPHRLPFTRSNTAIRTFRHALALDERRVRFKPALYAPVSAADAKLGTQPGDMPKNDTTWARRNQAERGAEPKKPKGGKGGKGGKNKQRNLERTFCESDPDCRHNHETDVLEVWFAGCHCDVGGGSVANDTAHTLARIPLRWMIRECFKTDTGIRFHAELLRRIGLDPFSLHPIVRERPPPVSPEPGHLGSVALPVAQSTEEEHEVRDALSPIYDQLEIAWMSWWPLELLPTTKKNKTDWPNMGKGRHVPKRHKPFYVHRSVKMRMEAQDLPGGSYAPKATFKHEPIWVD